MGGIDWTVWLIAMLGRRVTAIASLERRAGRALQ
jgi:hypothetical protein